MSRTAGNLKRNIFSRWIKYIVATHSAPFMIFLAPYIDDDKGN